MNADKNGKVPKIVRIPKERWMIEVALAELADGHEATPERIELAHGTRAEIDCIDLT